MKKISSFFLCFLILMTTSCQTVEIDTSSVTESLSAIETESRPKIYENDGIKAVSVKMTDEIVTNPRSNKNFQVWNISLENEDEVIGYSEVPNQLLNGSEFTLLFVYLNQNITILSQGEKKKVWGIIDKNGNIIQNFEYTSIFVLSDEWNLYTYQKSQGGTGLMNGQFEIITPQIYYSFPEGVYLEMLVATKKEDSTELYGFLNQDGEEITNFDNLYAQSLGYQQGMIYNGKTCSIIKEDGSVFNDEVFDYISGYRFIEEKLVVEPIYKAAYTNPDDPNDLGITIVKEQVITPDGTVLFDGTPYVLGQYANKLFNPQMPSVEFRGPLVYAYDFSGLPLIEVDINGMYYRDSFTKEWEQYKNEPIYQVVDTRTLDRGQYVVNFD